MRTLNVPDAPGWWRRKHQDGEVAAVEIIQNAGGFMIAHGDEVFVLRQYDDVLWRGPIPRPTEKEWDE